MTLLPLASDDPFYSRLQKSLGQSFLPLRTRKDACHPISDPLLFQYRHVAANLVLKTVKIVPSLHLDLAATCDAALERFVKDGHKFDPTQYENHGGDMEEHVHYATSVANEYISCIGLESIQVATKICIHPHAREWIRLFTLSLRQPFAEKSILNEGSVLTMYKDLRNTTHVPKTIFKILDSATIDKLADFPDLFPLLGFFSFYALTAPGVAIVKQMSGSSTFKWKGTSTVGARMRGLPRPPPPDAPQSIIKKVKRGGENSRRPVTRSETKGIVQIPGRKGANKGNYRPISNDYIQRAWAIAAAEDITFLIFNCGSYERIGFRHRASQTLYLSKLIDTSQTNPAYSKIHTGLHIAILQDALARYDDKKRLSEELKANKKRDAEELDDHLPPAHKRQRTTDVALPFKLANDVNLYQVNEVETVFSRRNLVLFKYGYGDYFSPSPSSFIRRGQSCVRGLFDKDFTPQIRKSTRYSSNEYVTITIGAPIGHGAVGVVHKGILEAETATGTLRQTCLVKLAYVKNDPLIQEFSFYQHLASNGVFDGILRVYGLFEDLETHATIMVMEYGGQNLVQRALEDNKDFDDVEMYIDEEARDAYIRALTQIHKAGILHGDIRLQNLIVSDSNEIAIIDFDRAEVCQNILRHESEMGELWSVLRVEGDTTSSGSNSSEEDAGSTGSSTARSIPAIIELP